MTDSFFEVEVKVVGVTDEEKTFKGCGSQKNIALRNAKKQARAFARRHNLTVRQDNCQQIEPKEKDEIFTYLFVDLDVPERQEVG